MADGSGTPFIPERDEPEPLRLHYAYNAMCKRWIAIVFDPRDPDENKRVLAVEFLQREQDCEPWFRKQLQDRPWDQKREERK